MGERRKAGGGFRNLPVILNPKNPAGIFTQDFGDFLR